MGDPVIRRILAEVSWEGRLTRYYHDGGRGRENVLSAEVLQALDLLPRAAFLAEVLKDAEGADVARQAVIAEVEDLVLDFLPGDIPLNPSIKVQPDAMLTGPTTLTLIEAKGPKASAFNHDQLSREYRVLLQEAAGRTPLMLLVLGSPPPARVKKREGLHDLQDAIAWELRSHEHGVDSRELDDMIARIGTTVAWTTWMRIGTVVDRARSSYADAGPGRVTVRRLAETIPAAVAWHSTV